MRPRLAFYFAELDRILEVDPRPKTIFGMSETCDVDLRHYWPRTAARTISRRHFEIAYVKHEGYVITDLHSLNGTRVNGQNMPPGEPRFLRGGDAIMLAENANFVIEVICEDEDRTETFAPVKLIKLEPADEAKLATGQLYLGSDGHFIVDDTRVPPQHFTAIEERLLQHLYERAGRVCAYDEIVREVWGYTKYDDTQDNTVAKAVSNLRKKLDDISPGAGPRYVRTVRGRGLTCTPV